MQKKNSKIACDDDVSAEEQGFVEYQESQIRQMYAIFVSVCQQIRKDSFEVEAMDAK